MNNNSANIVCYRFTVAYNTQNWYSYQNNINSNLQISYELSSNFNLTFAWILSLEVYSYMPGCTIAIHMLENALFVATCIWIHTFDQ